jgi:hypothetical protein
MDDPAALSAGGLPLLVPSSSSSTTLNVDKGERKSRQQEMAETARTEAKYVKKRGRRRMAKPAKSTRSWRMR